MDKQLKNIIWLSGFLEGEGTFSIRDDGSVRIMVASVDKDVLFKAHNIFKSTASINESLTNNGSVLYKTSVNGILAVSWMLTIYSLMGERRQRKIKEIILNWKLKKPHHKATNKYSKNVIYVNGNKTCQLHGPITLSNLKLRPNAKPVCKGCYNLYN